jgi:hypothetical protein
VEQGEVLRVHVEVPHGRGNHDQLEQPLQRIAVPGSRENSGDALEAYFPTVLLVFLIACRAEDLVEVFLVNASLGGMQGTVISLDHDGWHAIELFDPCQEGGEPGGPGEARPELLVVNGSRVIP